MSHDIAKKNAAKAAIKFIKPNTIVGLGSGSTSEYFISYLIEEVKNGLNITAVSSSKRSEEIAKKGNIPIKKIDEVPQIDITVDGADEIDSEKRMIKGGGAAHVREKILAVSSRDMIAIVDETKVVRKLGKRRLPVEVLPFGCTHVKSTLEKMNLLSLFRKNKDSSLLVTDNGNYILDVDIFDSKDSPESIHSKIKAVPGVVDTGFFFNIAKRVIIGFENKETKILD